MYLTDMTQTNCDTEAGSVKWLKVCGDQMCPSRVTFGGHRVCQGHSQKKYGRFGITLDCLIFQMCITASQIQWTADVTKALGLTKERGDKKALKSLKKKQVSDALH